MSVSWLPTHDTNTASSSKNAEKDESEEEEGEIVDSDEDNDNNDAIACSSAAASGPAVHHAPPSSIASFAQPQHHPSTATVTRRHQSSGDTEGSSGDIKGHRHHPHHSEGRHLGQWANNNNSRAAPVETGDVDTSSAFDLASQLLSDERNDGSIPPDTAAAAPLLPGAAKERRANFFGVSSSGTNGMPPTSPVRNGGGGRTSESAASRGVNVNGGAGGEKRVQAGDLPQPSVSGADTTSDNLKTTSQTRPVVDGAKSGDGSSSDLTRRLSALERLKSMKLGGGATLAASSTFNPFAVKVAKDNKPKTLPPGAEAQLASLSGADRPRKRLAAGAPYVDWDGQDDFQQALSSLHAPPKQQQLLRNQPPRMNNANFDPLGRTDDDDEQRPRSAEGHSFWTQQHDLTMNRPAPMRNVDNHAMLDYKKRIKGAANNLRRNDRQERARSAERQVPDGRAPHYRALRMSAEPPKPKPPTAADVQKKLQSLSLTWEDVNVLNRTNLVYLVCWVQTKEQELAAKFNQLETTLTDARLGYVDEQKSLAEAEWRRAQLTAALYRPPPTAALPRVAAWEPRHQHIRAGFDEDSARHHHRKQLKKLMDVDVQFPTQQRQQPVSHSQQQMLNTLALFNQLAFDFSAPQTQMLAEAMMPTAANRTNAPGTGGPSPTRVPKAPKLREGEQAPVSQWPPEASKMTQQPPPQVFSRPPPSLPPPAQLAKPPPFVAGPPPATATPQQQQRPQQPQQQTSALTPDVQMQRLMNVIATMSTTKADAADGQLTTTTSSASGVCVPNYPPPSSMPARPGPVSGAGMPRLSDAPQPVVHAGPTPLFARPIAPPNLSGPPPPQAVLGGPRGPPPLHQGPPPALQGPPPGADMPPRPQGPMLRLAHMMPGPGGPPPPQQMGVPPRVGGPPLTGGAPPGIGVPSVAFDQRAPGPFGPSPRKRGPEVSGGGTNNTVGGSKRWTDGQTKAKASSAAPKREISDMCVVVPDNGDYDSMT